MVVSLVACRCLVAVPIVLPYYPQIHHSVSGVGIIYTWWTRQATHIMETDRPLAWWRHTGHSLTWWILAGQSLTWWRLTGHSLTWRLTGHSLTWWRGPHMMETETVSHMSCIHGDMAHSLTHSWMNECTHSLTHSWMYSLNHSCTHLHIHSIMHSLTHSLTHSLMHSLVNALTHAKITKDWLYAFTK